MNLPPFQLLRVCSLRLQGFLCAVLVCLTLGAMAVGAEAFTYPTDAPLVVPIKDTAYAVPARAVIVAPDGLDAGAGTLSSPLSLKKALSSSPAGSTLVLRGGTYRGIYNQTIPKKMTLQPYPHESAWIDGSLPVTQWTPEGSLWWMNTRPTGLNFEFPSNGDPNVVDAAANALANDREMVFADNTPLVQVATLEEVTPTTFYVRHDDATTSADDAVSHRLYIGFNPAGRTVEVTSSSGSTFGRGLNTYQSGQQIPDGTVIRGLGFRKSPLRFFGHYLP